MHRGQRRTISSQRPLAVKTIMDSDRFFQVNRFVLTVAESLRRDVCIVYPAVASWLGYRTSDPKDAAVGPSSEALNPHRSDRVVVHVTAENVNRFCESYRSIFSTTRSRSHDDGVFLTWRPAFFDGEGFFFSSFFFSLTFSERKAGGAADAERKSWFRRRCYPTPQTLNFQTGAGRTQSAPRCFV